MAGTPIILADNILEGATLTASSTAEGFDIRHISDRRPYTWWHATASGTATITIDCGTAKTADAIGIIGHNMGAAVTILSLAHSTDAMTWTTVINAVEQPVDTAMLRLFVAATARFWRLTLATTAAAPSLAVVFIGTRLEFPYPPDSAYTPFTGKTEEESQTSKTGNCLGTVIRFQAIEIKPQFSWLTRTWVSQYFDPFWRDYGRQRKYHFWAWDLTTYPDHVFYVRQNGAYEAPVTYLNYIDKLKLEMKGLQE